MQTKNNKLTILTENYEKTKDKQTCCQCKTGFKQHQPRYLHDYYGYPCGRVVCLHCCLIKAEEYALTNKSIFLKCSGKTSYDLPQILNQLLLSVCIICGTDCKSQKVTLTKGKTQILVGMTCYTTLKNKSYMSKSYYQAKIFQEIGKFSSIKCNACTDKLINFIELSIKSIDITANQKQIAQYRERRDLKICKQCYHDGKKNQKKISTIQHKICSQCKQIDIYQQLPGFFNRGAKKQFTVIQIQKQWPFKKSSSKVQKCSFCIYKDYLQTQNQNSRLKMDKRTYNTLKIRYQQYFEDSCMVCSVKVKNQALNYPIKSGYHLGICSFMCKRCYEGHTQSNLISKQSRQILQYKSSTQIRSFLQKTNQYKLQHKVMVKRQIIQETSKIKIQNYQKQIQIAIAALKNANGKPFDSIFHDKTQNQFEYPIYDQPQFNNPKLSMINHVDMQSQSHRSQIDLYEYENSFKCTILEPQTQKNSRSYIQASMKDEQNESNSLIREVQDELRNSSDEIFAEARIKDFRYVPPQKRQNQFRNFNIDSWQKSLIQEFKSISQKDSMSMEIPEKPYKLPSQQKWAQRLMILQQQSPFQKQKCLMYKQCKVQQQCLKIQLLCNLCFVKYLIGDKRVIETVSTKKQLDLKKIQPNIKLQNSESTQSRPKEQKGILKDVISWF